MNDKGIYKELYHYDDKHSLVMNEITHDVCFMKTLVHYDLSVYQYIKDNPNKFIPRIYDIMEQNGVLRVVEEYIQGSSFDSVIGMRERVIIHRDIKLSNIIIAEDGDLKIIDYDAAKVYKPGAKRDTVLIGTEGMAAPEQYGFRQSDERTDIYAIGLLIREAFPNDKRLLRVADKASAFNPDEIYANISERITALRGGNPNGKRSFFPIPGFRTGVTYKKVICVMFWIAVIMVAFVFNAYRQDNMFKYIVFALYVFVSAFLSVDMIFDWTGLFLKAPGADLKGALKYTVRILYAIATAALLLIVMGLIITYPDVLIREAGGK